MVGVNGPKKTHFITGTIIFVTSIVITIVNFLLFWYFKERCEGASYNEGVGAGWFGQGSGAVGGFGGGGGGSEDNGASGGGGGSSGGGSGTHKHQAGGGGGSYCSGEDCSGLSGGNINDDGAVQMYEWLG